MLENDVKQKELRYHYSKLRAYILMFATIAIGMPVIYFLDNITSGKSAFSWGTFSVGVYVAISVIINWWEINELKRFREFAQKEIK